MIKQIERELNEWMTTAKDLGIEGMEIGDSSKDPQRKKLSWCISREILIQCQQINHIVEELLKSMDDILEFIDEGQEFTKTLRRK